MILARATVQAHRMLGAAIEKAREAGIADPESLIAVYIAEIAKAKATEEARHAAMTAAAEEHGVDPASVQSAYIAATPKPKRQVRGGEK
ncbi:hypothetical protein [Magnetospirillum aberrantis]|uniref:Uncharacterized protein n=1 Tax=Magnetospirillum aberrantis SpK TaxID=908842 RepID=A0A7C9QRS2_9PROT|nr:hypothetical protein [Magnetospirillum aberrantis]NFV79005.1 hypothetical protein [Magnetospirillum aberrantis SpK]